MTRCDSCGRETSFLSPEKDCYDCAKHDPLERAAIALYGCNPLSVFYPWAHLSDADRELVRDQAVTALTAAVDREELERLLMESIPGARLLQAANIAATVTTHYLGTEIS